MQSLNLSSATRTFAPNVKSEVVPRVNRMVSRSAFDEGKALPSLTPISLGPSAGGKAPVQAGVNGKAGASGPKEVELKSEVGMDYTPLKEALAAAEFQKADDETRALLIKLAGPEAVKRGWVYFSEVKFISATDLQTIDNLWKAYSNGKFGFTIQRELWLQNKKQWQKFFKKIDWTTGEFSIYRKWPAEFDYTIEAPKGHLPLTNALRGTQLFNAILEHPAFNKPMKSLDGVTATNGSGTPAGGKPTWMV